MGKLAQLFSWNCVIVAMTTTFCTQGGRLYAADEEITPELKVLFSKFKDDIKSKTSATRASAYKSIGELGAKAKPIRRELCEGLLDPALSVRTAAADALKNVDEAMQKLALAIVINKDLRSVEQAGKGGKANEAMLPIISRITIEAAQFEVKITPSIPREKERAALDVITCVNALVLISTEETVVNNSVLSLLTNPNPTLRACAIGHVPKLKNKKLALPSLVKFATSPTDVNRIASINVIPEVVDENSSTATKTTLEKMRFDTDPKVRDAVENALKRFK